MQITKNSFKFYCHIFSATNELLANGQTCHSFLSGARMEHKEFTWFCLHETLWLYLPLQIKKNFSSDFENQGFSRVRNLNVTVMSPNNPL